MDQLFLSLQRLLPQHGLSRLIGMLAKSDHPVIRKALIKGFLQLYDVNLSDAALEDVEDYRSFNDFFTRSLKSDARTICGDEGAIVSPVDGCISQLGAIEGGTLFQAKGHKYRLSSLAGDTGRGLDGGKFCTIYLAPADYHRVHLPCNGELVETRAFPGALFSVNGTTEAGIEGLFCRNERLVCRFETEFGPMLVIFVGALIVASIETVWPGPSSPYQRQSVQALSEMLRQGDEIGRFLLGSTVICCFPPESVDFDNALAPGTNVRMGALLGRRA